MNGYKGVYGNVHSLETMGAVDGPGVRFIVFLKGCALRCGYCHNPDSWDSKGSSWTPKALCERILRYKPYFTGGGGVTVSGGEPLLQPRFTAALFKELKGCGIHTALDTSGIAPLEPAKDVLLNTDLVLCDIKFLTLAEYKKYCSLKSGSVFEFLDLTERLNVPVWVRHVVVPGLTNNENYLSEIYKKAYSYKNVQKVELLPFKKLCKGKYESLKLKFKFDKFDEMDPKELIELEKKIAPLKQGNV